MDGCGAFVVLVGRDGVRRWIGAETQAALSRHFSPHDDAQRLPIFPILLDGAGPETLPAFLRLFQMTPWNGADRCPSACSPTSANAPSSNEAIPFEGCPFVGLAAYRIDQAHLFFGRQKETLDALACFDIAPGSPAVRWLEINGNSGSGKSSLMQAGLLPLVDQGWLWRPHGLRALEAHRADDAGRAPGRDAGRVPGAGVRREDGRVVKELREGDDALRYWLRERKAATTPPSCSPSISSRSCSPSPIRTSAAASIGCSPAPWRTPTARCSSSPRCAPTSSTASPRPAAAGRRAQPAGRPWTLAPIGADGLREVIDGPARLAGLDVSEIREAMVARRATSRVPCRWSRTRCTGYGRSARATASAGSCSPIRAGPPAFSATAPTACSPRSTRRNGTGRWTCCSGWSGSTRRAFGTPASGSLDEAGDVPAAASRPGAGLPPRRPATAATVGRLQARCG